MSRQPGWLRASSPVPTYIGIAVAVAGFVLIVVAWAAVAGKTQVWEQVPYVVSAGITGLGLIIVGVAIVNVATRRRDADERSREMERLANVMDELKSALRRPSPRKR